MDKSNEHSSVDQYIADFPEDIQKRMQQLRKAIREEIPNVKEAIKYQMPTFMNENEVNVAYFGAYKSHIGFYPFPSGVEEFERLTDKYSKSGKGTIQFQHDESLPLDLVKKIIKFRLKEIGNSKANYRKKA